MKKLGVNIDHVATLRNARGETHPNPLKAAVFAKQNGADSITIHLREDRRHINDIDAYLICKKKIPVNLEVSINPKIIKIAVKIMPNYICIVPENRKEITTEGGLNLKKYKKNIKKIIDKFKKKKIRTSLFVNANLDDLRICNELKVDCIELHTGEISRLVKTKKNYSKELLKIKRCCKKAYEYGIEVHAGHGLDYKTTKILSKINEIKEFNIGHFIIGESIFFGLKNVIRKFKKIINF